MKSANKRSGVRCRRLLWAAGAAIAVAVVLQGVAMAQGVPAGYPPPNGPQYAVAGDPAAPPALAPAPAPGAPPPVVQGPISQDYINAMVDQRLREIAAAKAQQDAQQKQLADQQGYVVGSDLHATASFQDGLFLWMTTPNKDFTMHIGGWMQFDNVFWDQSPALKTMTLNSSGKQVSAGTAQGVASGANLGGIGDLQDGDYFRRIRPFAEGTFWETGEYRLIIALENDQFDTTGLDEFWVGESKIPVLGTVRVGHVKTPMGLEGDMTASSRCMTFMERSSYSQAIEMDQNFVTGLWIGNSYLDQRATSTFSVFRPDVAAATGYSFGDDQWGWQGRLTALPIYEDEGRTLVHVGLSGGWRSGSTNLGTLSSNTGLLNTVSLACRSEMRDDVPAKDATNGDSNNMLSTGAIACDNQYLMGLEFLGIRGPLSLQAEYGWTFLDDCAGISSNPVSPTKFATPQNYVFDGGYIQLAYTLTGENRAYDKRGGTLAREYFGKAGPTSKFFFVRDENGNLISSWGAWEVALRYSHVDLNDGTNTGSGAGTDYYRIQGGEMDGLTLALNWYLSNNMNIMLDWAYDNRYDLPKEVSGTAATTCLPGHTNGVGCRVQYQF
ncbi:MAG: OprO/OprP family phosphate-selective porin [Thermoguttaceae bacterium]